MKLISFQYREWVRATLHMYRHIVQTGVGTYNYILYFISKKVVVTYYNSVAD